ncbi:hypothetical protein EHS25_000234 [Saitozyma podzolica]|uniref:Uracil-DNA glycosylase-like domain-containing protein n=1 Tax=Saitozyma podzolica TaxID=1890683 RepID=A0A427YVI2_9TREE|nr:hypothetical protein EHS25_000234 [Saitozyma podzolica]
MSEDDPTPSPASKAFAARLAKYAYNPASSSSSRSGSGRASPTVRAVTGPTVHLPASPGASSSRSVPSAMRTPRSRRAKRPVPVDDEDEYDESQLPSDEGPSRRKMVSTKKGQGKKPRPFAGPEVYAHLRPVPDLLGQDLDIVFCGINPGKMSAVRGHHFAHPTNKFWRALHMSELTHRLLSPAEDHLLPGEYNYGLTNLCGRPTSEQSELSTLEMRLNVYPFTLKLMEHRPRLVCFVGKKIWDVYESVAGKTATATATVTASPTGKGTATGTGAITHFDPVTPVTPITPVKLEQAEEVLADLECAPEQGHEDSSPTIVKLEEGIVPGYPPSTPSPSPGRVQPGVQPKPQRRPITPKSTQSAKRTFDWTQPRALRLPLPPSRSARGKATANDVDVEPHSHCYFWVVPSTSGLERTPMSDQIVLFSQLRAFSQQLKSGAIDVDVDVGFRDISLEGLEQTTEQIRIAAASKSSG